MRGEQIEGLRRRAARLRRVYEWLFAFMIAGNAVTMAASVANALTEGSLTPLIFGPLMVSLALYWPWRWVSDAEDRAMRAAVVLMEAELLEAGPCGNPGCPFCSKAFPR